MVKPANNVEHLYSACSSFAGVWHEPDALLAEFGAVAVGRPLASSPVSGESAAAVAGMASPASNCHTSLTAALQDDNCVLGR
jgi:hypothetical protein